MKRFYLLSICLGILCLPQVAVADTDTYRQQLLQQITALQLQIAELQALLETRQRELSVVQDGPYTAQVSVVAAYQPTANNHWIIENSTHRRYLQELLAVWPGAYSSRLNRLVVFNESRAPYDAYVESRTDSLNVWTYGVGDELVAKPKSDANQELLIHELAHVFAYDLASEVVKRKPVCGVYFSALECPPIDSYLGQFIATFWSAGQLADAERMRDVEDSESAAYRYYQANPGEFVSDYAAQNPVEDFAESYLFYAMDLSLDCRECVAAEKVSFFSQFPELRL